MKSPGEYNLLLREIVDSIYENIRDLEGKRAFCDEEERDYIEGRIFSYGEMLEIIKFRMRDHGIHPSEAGIR